MREEWREEERFYGLVALGAFGMEGWSGFDLMTTKDGQEILTFAIESAYLRRGDDSKRKVCCGVTKPPQEEQTSGDWRAIPIPKKMPFHSLG